MPRVKLELSCLRARYGRGEVAHDRVAAAVGDVYGRVVRYDPSYCATMEQGAADSGCARRITERLVGKGSRR